jgi:hypothetical protein
MPVLAMELNFFLFYNSIGVAGVACVLAAFLAVLYGSYKGLQDLVRFGRSDAPWFVAIVFAIILGGGAVWMWGASGLLVGFTALGAFAWGKLRMS